MSYESYAYIQSLILAAGYKLEKEFRSACIFIPPEDYNPKKPSGLDKAHQIFMAASHKINQAHLELKDLASQSYKDHPNKEMREFWGLTE